MGSPSWGDVVTCPPPKLGFCQERGRENRFGLSTRLLTTGHPDSPGLGARVTVLLATTPPRPSWLSFTRERQEAAEIVPSYFLICPSSIIILSPEKTEVRVLCSLVTVNFRTSARAVEGQRLLRREGRRFTKDPPGAAPRAKPSACALPRHPWISARPKSFTPLHKGGSRDPDRSQATKQHCP